MTIRSDYVKSPASTKDFGMDWSRWLSEGDSIQGVVWNIPSPLTRVSEHINGSITSVFISDGVLGRDYELECTVTTAQGRIKDETMLISVE